MAWLFVNVCVSQFKVILTLIARRRHDEIRKDGSVRAHLISRDSFDKVLHETNSVRLKQHKFNINILYICFCVILNFQVYRYTHNLKKRRDVVGLLKCQ